MKKKRRKSPDVSKCFALINGKTTYYSPTKRRRLALIKQLREDNKLHDGYKLYDPVKK